MSGNDPRNAVFESFQNLALSNGMFSASTKTYGSNFTIFDGFGIVVPAPAEILENKSPVMEPWPTNIQQSAPNRKGPQPKINTNAMLAEIAYEDEYLNRHKNRKSRIDPAKQQKKAAKKQRQRERKAQEGNK